MGDDNTQTVITDLTVSYSTDRGSCPLDPRKWHRIEKDLYLHTEQHSAWLHIARAKENELGAEELVVTAVSVGDTHSGTGVDDSWESRSSGIYVLRSRYAGNGTQYVTDVDVLFGSDAVDPRPRWTLMRSPLQLNTRPDVPVARLTVHYGRAQRRPPGTRTTLTANEDGKFKIVQISDTHMVTGAGVCRDGIDANGHLIPETEADQLTLAFVGKVLDVEKPDIVILTGDQLHHNILDSQSALFKLVAPFIERSIPYAVVFGNHDDEGSYAMSRFAQMSLLRDLPFSLSQPGPESIDGVGNYYLQIFAPEPSQQPALATLFFLDSHGEILGKERVPDYRWIEQSQIDWFKRTSRSLRNMRRKDDRDNNVHLALAFMHIPLPEYADTDLIIRGGHVAEPIMCPTFNSHFYEALCDEGVVAVGCGHDHVNDFCGLKPQRRRGKSQEGGNINSQLGPWLCYGGVSGFGAYSSHREKHYHRRTRVWELDTSTGGLKTWKRVEYARERVDELMLVDNGAVVAP